MSKRLKYPELLLAVIVFTGVCIFRGLVFASAYSLFFLIPLWLLIWHYAMPTRTGWLLIIAFMLLPYLFMLGEVWRLADFHLDLASLGNAGIATAMDLVLSVAWVPVTAYASQVTREDA